MLKFGGPQDWPLSLTMICSTLVQVMTCCLTAPNHYLNQCWQEIIIHEANWHLAEGNFTETVVCHSLQRVWKLQILTNSLWPSDAIWRHRSGSTLALVMACCLTAPSHYLNQCWLITSTDQWRLSKGNFTRDTPAIIHKNQLQFA